MVFSQTVAADSSVATVYQQGFELAEQTYKQSADAWAGNGRDMNQMNNQQPVSGTFVNNEEQK